MPLNIVQVPSCSKACVNCSTASQKLGICDGHSKCQGYGTSSSCPPMIVFAMLEAARIALTVDTYPRGIMPLHCSAPATRGSVVGQMDI